MLEMGKIRPAIRSVEIDFGGITRPSHQMSRLSKAQKANPNRLK
jgi:hypothetical protein